MYAICLKCHHYSCPWGHSGEQRHSGLELWDIGIDKNFISIHIYCYVGKVQGVRKCIIIW